VLLAVQVNLHPEVGGNEMKKAFGLIKRKVIQLWFELGDLSWTLAGTGLVLITLSGDTLKWGMYMSGAALAIHLLVLISSSGDD